MSADPLAGSAGSPAPDGSWEMLESIDEDVCRAAFGSSSASVKRWIKDAHTSGRKRGRDGKFLDRAGEFVGKKGRTVRWERLGDFDNSPYRVWVENRYRPAVPPPPAVLPPSGVQMQAGYTIFEQGRRMSGDGWGLAATERDELFGRIRELEGERKVLLALVPADIRTQLQATG